MSVVKHTTNKSDNKVVITKEYTKLDIERLVLLLALSGKASQRGIQTILKDCLGYNISLGSINGILQKFGHIAAGINKSEDLSAIEQASLDEIFQGSCPVLAMVDNNTGYIGILSKEQSRDSVTWGVNLLDAVAQGFDPKYTVADGARGLRAGQELALEDIPCFGDVFHALKEINDLLHFRSNRAYSKINQVDKMRKTYQAGKHSLSELNQAQEDMVASIQIVETIETLSHWLQNDVLSIIGESYDARCDSYDFVVQELDKLYKLRPCKRIKKVINYLKGQKKNLLMFVKEVDNLLIGFAKKHKVSYPLLRKLFELQRQSRERSDYWEQESYLRKQLGVRYQKIMKDILAIPKLVVRASSWVENINSRLRDYLNLIRQVGQNFLELLRFYFNYKPFLRSAHKERVNKSPKELLSGDSHSHWLDILIEHGTQAVA